MTTLYQHLEAFAKEADACTTSIDNGSLDELDQEYFWGKQAGLNQAVCEIEWNIMNPLEEYFETLTKRAYDSCFDVYTHTEFDVLTRVINELREIIGNRPESLDE